VVIDFTIAHDGATGRGQGLHAGRRDIINGEARESQNTIWSKLDGLDTFRSAGAKRSQALLNLFVCTAAAAVAAGT
jgi:hypothetical protein